MYWIYWPSPRAHRARGHGPIHSDYPCIELICIRSDTNASGVTTELFHLFWLLLANNEAMSREANAGKKRGKYSGGCIGSPIDPLEESGDLSASFTKTYFYFLEHKNIFLILPSHQSGRAVSLIARTSFTIDLLCCHEVATIDKI